MATSFFGGLLGKAEKEITSRKSRMDQMESDANSGKDTPKAEIKTDESKTNTRPPMSKKWTE